MLNRRPIIILALLAVVAGFAWGVAQLFQLRFSAGDIYPEYSSFRSDPLGTRAYYEALHHLGGSVERNLRGSEHLPHGAGATIFVLGLSSRELRSDEKEFRALEAFVRNGGRLAISLYPEYGIMGARAVRPSTNAPSAPHPPGEQIDLGAKWGFALTSVPVQRKADQTYPAVTTRSLVQELPDLSWHTALVFTNVGLDWKVIYARDSDAVLIERRLGAGTIVIATDSYFVSNEALQGKRAPATLAWLAGPNQKLVFDEVHLGIHEEPGIAALARRYNLHGGVIALLALAALFVWKSSVSFVPRSEIPGENDEVRGRDSAAGFVNLLRRSIRPEQLLQTCLDEWHKARSLDRRASPRRLEKVAAAVEASNAAPQKNSVATYNEISRILNEK